MINILCIIIISTIIIKTIYLSLLYDNVIEEICLTTNIFMLNINYNITKYVILLYNPMKYIRFG